MVDILDGTSLYDSGPQLCLVVVKSTRTLLYQRREARRSYPSQKPLPKVALLASAPISLGRVHHLIAEFITQLVVKQVGWCVKVITYIIEQEG